MAGIDVLTLAVARKFTTETVNGLGALKGAACTIDSIVDTGDANVVTFGWTGSDGSHQTSVMTIPHGMSETAKTELENRLAEIESVAKHAEEVAERAEAAVGDGCDCTGGTISAEHDGQGNVVFHLTGMTLVDDGNGNISII